jgi:hypothetical protein
MGLLGYRKSKIGSTIDGYRGGYYLVKKEEKGEQCRGMVTVKITVALVHLWEENLRIRNEPVGNG